jgi:hypothetical protein
MDDKQAHLTAQNRGSGRYKTALMLGLVAMMAYLATVTGFIF